MPTQGGRFVPVFAASHSHGFFSVLLTESGNSHTVSGRQIWEPVHLLLSWLPARESNCAIHIYCDVIITCWKISPLYKTKFQYLPMSKKKKKERNPKHLWAVSDRLFSCHINADLFSIEPSPPWQTKDDGLKGEMLPTACKYICCQLPTELTVLSH